MIPEEVVEAAAVAIAQWHDGDDKFRKLYRMDARLAIAAALNAWPGVWVHPYTKHITLSAENSDE